MAWIKQRLFQCVYDQSKNSFIYHWHLTFQVHTARHQTAVCRIMQFLCTLHTHTPVADVVSSSQIMIIHGASCPPNIMYEVIPWVIFYWGPMWIISLIAVSKIFIISKIKVMSIFLLSLNLISSEKTGKRRVSARRWIPVRSIVRPGAPRMWSGRRSSWRRCWSPRWGAWGSWGTLSPSLCSTGQIHIISRKVSIYCHMCIDQARDEIHISPESDLLVCIWDCIPGIGDTWPLLGLQLTCVHCPLPLLLAPDEEHPDVVWDLPHHEHRPGETDGGLQTH